VHPHSEKPWSLKQYFFLEMGGFVVQTGPETKKYFHPWDLLQLLQEGKVEMPDLEDKDVDDRSKANWFTKSISLIQICWFLLQLLARAIEHLPITTLELYTLGIVLCAILIYGSYWHKPFDVQRPVVLQATDAEYAWPGVISRVGLIDADQGRSIIDGQFSSLMTLVSIGFSVPHLIGWNFDFVSKVEQWVWRVGSICCMVLPPAMYARGHKRFDILKSDRLKTFLVLCMILLYIVVRIALFVEMFAGLRSVPAGAYQTPRWSDYIPSFG
jgi:hypothetical protein